MKRTIAISLSLACGACAGWAFALAVDLARNPPAELSVPAAPPARARAALPGPDAATRAAEGAAPKAAAPEAERETVADEDEGGCG